MTDHRHRAGRRYAAVLLVALWLGNPGAIGATALDNLPTVLNVSPVDVGGGSVRRQVRALALDERGFVWIGTLNGLLRCDGEEVTEFLHDPNDSGTLSGNGIWSLCADGAGQLWAGTWGSGLNRIDIRSGRIRRFRHRPGNPESLPDDRIRALYMDRKQRLWIGTEGAGAAVYDSRTGRFRRIDGYSGLEGDLYRPIRQFQEDGKGRLWVATDRGLYRIEKRDNTMHRVWPEAGTDQLVLGMICRDDGSIWLAAVSGLVQVRPDGEVVHVYRSDSSRLDKRLQRPVPASLLEDREGHIWVGFLDAGGLDRVDPDTGRIAHFPPQTRGAGRLPDDGVVQMIQDGSGLIWCGFQSHSGVSVLNPRRPITHFLPREKDEDGLSDPEVTAVLRDRSGHLWFGTSNGLDRFDPTTEKWSHFQDLGRDIRGNPIVRVWDLLEDDLGRIWIGTWGGGVLILDPRNGAIRPLTAANDAQHPLVNPVIIDLDRDGAGRIWIGTDGGGMGCWDPRDSRLTRYRHDPGNPFSLASDIVMAITDDGDAGLWIGTWGGGLNHLSVRDGEILRYRYDPENPGSLSNDTVLCLARGRDGTLWAGTHAGGLNRLDPDKRTFRRYTRALGLPDNMVMAIQEDGEGNLWIATAAGLARLNPRSGEIRAFDRKDGLLTRGFSMRAAYRDEAGRLYFGGIGGVSAFLPSGFAPNPAIPPLHFTSLEIFARQRVTVCLPDTPSIRIGYRESFRIGFAALDYTNPGSNRYAYRLQENGGEWIDLGRRNAITFAGMQPGRYRLHVRGAGSDGVWNHAGAVMRIHVVPPFWMRWWFRGLFLIALIALFLYWHRTRMRRQAGRLRQENEIDEFCRRFGISDREREVLILLLQGMNRTRIADKLIISDATVKNHTYSLYRKLNIRSRAQLFSLFGAWKH
ncbi:MAG: hypothetical protein JXA62_09345 [Candidatus Aminicenantes bacterium]|nr:hypothetical protein [Candidatus Aminicenantes bacterium]